MNSYKPGSRAGVLSLVHAAVIAAIYVVLTMLAASVDLASGAIQVRFSEALTILPYFTPAAIPGVTLGCLLANILTGCALPDVIFGTLATFLGAVFTNRISRRLHSHARKNAGDFAAASDGEAGITLKGRLLSSLPPVISNTVIVPLILTYAYHIPGGIPYLMLTVGIGEILSCCVLGLILLRALLPLRHRLFETENG